MKITVATAWDDVTVNQYQALTQVNKEDYKSQFSQCTFRHEGNEYLLQRHGNKAYFWLHHELNEFLPQFLLQNYIDINEASYFASFALLFAD